MWETLNNVEGDGEFVDADFKRYKKSSPVPTKPQSAVIGDQSTSRQFDNEYVLLVFSHCCQILADNLIQFYSAMLSMALVQQTV